MPSSISGQRYLHVYSLAAYVLYMCVNMHTIKVETPEATSTESL